MKTIMNLIKKTVRLLCKLYIHLELMKYKREWWFAELNLNYVVSIRQMTWAVYRDDYMWQESYEKERLYKRTNIWVKNKKIFYKEE